jgi:hypothetical protein
MSVTYLQADLGAADISRLSAAGACRLRPQLSTLRLMVRKTERYTRKKMEKNSWYR